MSMTRWPIVGLIIGQLLYCGDVPIIDPLQVSAYNKVVHELNGPWSPRVQMRLSLVRLNPEEHRLAYEYAWNTHDIKTVNHLARVLVFQKITKKS